MQFNCDGINTMLVEIQCFLKDNGIKVACLQETKLRHESNTPKFPGYNVLRRDRPRNDGGGGLAILVHETVQFLPIDCSFNNDPHIKLQGISAIINGSSVDVFNLYIPPNSSPFLPPGYTPSITSLLNQSDGDAIICGDFNAHHVAWFSHRNDARGISLLDEISNSTFVPINQNEKTRLPHAANHVPTSPDITLVIPCQAQE